MRELLAMTARPNLYRNLFVVFVLTLLQPARALAGSWEEDWGTLVWSSLPTVPALSGSAFAALALLLLLASALLIRSRRLATVLSRGAVHTIAVALLLVPMIAYAGNLSVPNSFTNGTVADADEVNANFTAAETEVNDNDTRITTLESGISGWEIVAGGTAFCAGAFTTVDATCTGSKKLLGGSCSSNDFTTIHIGGSFPAPNSDNAWRCAFSCNGATSQLFTQVICADVP